MRVFVSSTVVDLEAFRSAAIGALQRAELSAAGVELFHTSETGTAQKCIDEVRKADLYVLIVGYRYGTLVPGHDVSYTELEYRTALEEATSRGLRICAYLLSDGPVDGYDVSAADQDQARVRVFRRVVSEKVVEFVKSPNDLAQAILSGIIAAPITADINATSLALSTAQERLRTPVWLTADVPLPLEPHVVIEAANLRLGGGDPEHADHGSPSDSIRRLLTSHDRVLLVGNAGVGKSTFLYAMAADLAMTGSPAFVVEAVRVRDVHHQRPELSVHECLLWATAASLNLTEPRRRQFSELGLRGGVAFLVDQAEVLTEGELSWLTSAEGEWSSDEHGFHKVLPNKFSMLLATRRAPSTQAGRIGTRVEMRPQRRDAVLRMSKWAASALGLDVTRVRESVDQLLSEPGVAELLGHPLFLLFALRTQILSDQLRLGRDRLTREVVTELLKQPRRDDPASDFGSTLTNQELRALGAAAAHSDRDAAARWIEEIHVALGAGATSDTARGVLGTLVRSGLLVEDEGHVTFTHAVFREHFIALWLMPSLRRGLSGDSLAQLVLESGRRHALVTALSYLTDEGEHALVDRTLDALASAGLSDPLFGLLHYEVIVAGELLSRLPDPPPEVLLVARRILLGFLESASPGFHLGLISTAAEEFGNHVDLKGIINQQHPDQWSPPFLANVLTFARLCRSVAARAELELLARKSVEGREPYLRYAASLFLSDGGSDAVPRAIPDSLLDLSLMDQIGVQHKKAYADGGRDAVEALINLASVTSESLSLQTLCIDALLHSAVHGVATVEDIGRALIEVKVWSDGIGRRLREAPDSIALGNAWVNLLMTHPNPDGEHLAGSWLSGTLDSDEIQDLIELRPNLRPHFLEVLVEAAVDAAPKSVGPSDRLLSWTAGGHAGELRASVLMRFADFRVNPGLEAVLKKYEHSTTHSVAVAAGVARFTLGLQDGVADQIFRKAEVRRERMVRLRAVALLPFVSDGLLTWAVGRLQRDEESMVRSALARVSDDLRGARSKAAMGVLMALLSDRSMDVQADAFVALARHPDASDESRQMARKWLIDKIDSTEVGKHEYGGLLAEFPATCQSATDFADIIVRALRSELEYVHAGIGNVSRVLELTRTRLSFTAVANSLRDSIAEVSFVDLPVHASWFGALARAVMLEEPWPTMDAVA